MPTDRPPFPLPPFESLGFESRSRQPAGNAQLQQSCHANSFESAAVAVCRATTVLARASLRLFRACRISGLGSDSEVTLRLPISHLFRSAYMQVSQVPTSFLP